MEAQKEVIVTQTTLNGRLREVRESSDLLEQENLTLKQEKSALQSLNSKQQQLIDLLQTELTQLPLPQAPSMTTHDEQELLDLLESSENLIQQQKTTIEKRDTTVAELRALINNLDI